jgi:hypothetical protein
VPFRRRRDRRLENTPHGYPWPVSAATPFRDGAFFGSGLAALGFGSVAAFRVHRKLQVAEEERLRLPAYAVDLAGRLLVSQVLSGGARQARHSPPSVIVGTTKTDPCARAPPAIYPWYLPLNYNIIVLSCKLLGRPVRFLRRFFARQ